MIFGDLTSYKLNIKVFLKTSQRLKKNVFVQIGWAQFQGEQSLLKCAFPTEQTIMEHIILYGKGGAHKVGKGGGGSWDHKKEGIGQNAW